MDDIGLFHNVLSIAFFLIIKNIVKKGKWGLIDYEHMVYFNVDIIF